MFCKISDPVMKIKSRFWDFGAGVGNGDDSREGICCTDMFS